MNLYDALVEALKAEHQHIESGSLSFNSSFDARLRAKKIVDRLTELTEKENFNK